MIGTLTVGSTTLPILDFREETVRLGGPVRGSMAAAIRRQEAMQTKIEITTPILAEPSLMIGFVIGMTTETEIADAIHYDERTTLPSRWDTCEYHLPGQDISGTGTIVGRTPELAVIRWSIVPFYPAPFAIPPVYPTAWKHLLEDALE